MEKQDLQNSIKCLKEQCKRYEDQLKIWRINIDELPDDISSMLEDCAELQLKTGLYDLHKNYVKELVFEKEQQNIEHKLRVAKLNAEIKKSKLESEELTKQINMLNECLNSGQTVLTEGQFERQKSDIEAQINEFERKKDSIFISADIDIELLMQKVDILEQRREKEAKSGQK